MAWCNLEGLTFFYFHISHDNPFCIDADGDRHDHQGYGGDGYAEDNGMHRLWIVKVRCLPQRRRHCGNHVDVEGRHCDARVGVSGVDDWLYQVGTLSV